MKKVIANSVHTNEKVGDFMFNIRGGGPAFIFGSYLLAARQLTIKVPQIK